MTDKNQPKDPIMGDKHNNTLEGTKGNDLMIGKGGNDLLKGGVGNDTYYFNWTKKNEGHDIIKDLKGENVVRITVTSFDEIYFDGPVIKSKYNPDVSIDLSKANIKEIQLVDASGRETGLTLSQLKAALNNREDKIVITGSDGGDYLSPGLTNWWSAHKIDAKGGNDTITGGFKDDEIDCGDGNDFASGDAGNDTIYGGKGEDTIFGGAGNDILYGGDNKDTLHGGANDDTLHGGNDQDTLLGDEGNDILIGGSGDDYLNGGAGHDNYVFSAKFDWGHDTILNDNEGVNKIIITDVTDPAAISFETDVKGSNVVCFKNATGTVSKITITHSMVQNIYLKDAKGKVTAVYMLKDGKYVLKSPTKLSREDTTRALIKGTNGNDSLGGTSGDDVIIGYGGDDKMFGGAGNDNYVVSAKQTFGYDEIYNDIHGTNQIIVTDAAFSSENQLKTQIAFLNNHKTLWFGTGKQIRLINTHIATIAFKAQYTEGVSLVQYYHNVNGKFVKSNFVTLEGNSQNNLIKGTKADEVMLGGMGDDTYFIDASTHFGYDIVKNDNHGHNAIVFNNATFDEHGQLLSLPKFTINNGNMVVEVGAGKVCIMNANIKQLIFKDNKGNFQYYHNVNGKFVKETSFAQSSVTANRGYHQVYGTQLNDSKEYFAKYVKLHEQNHIHAYNGNDHIVGGFKDDIIVAGNGNDILDGGLGNDQLEGGHGNDIYRYNLKENFGHDTIAEPSVNGGNDTIEVYAADIFDANGKVVKEKLDKVCKLQKGTNGELQLNFFANGKITIMKGSQIENIMFKNGKHVVYFKLPANGTLTHSTASLDFNRFRLNNLELGQASQTKRLALLNNKAEGMLS